MAKQIHMVVDDIIATQMKNPNEQHTLLAHMLGHYNPEDPGSISLQQIRNEIVVLLMAGHETTANTLAWSWYLLAEHPRVVERLHGELDSVLGDRTPGFDDVSKLPYTRAVFEETMRLYPPVPILSREAIGEDQIGKYHVPQGAQVVVSPWLLHRHRSYWDHPDHFIPERFTGEWSNKNIKYTYIPFSTGPRNCLGAAFGLTEAILCLAVLAQKFNPVLQPGHKPGYDCRLTLRPAGSLPMIARPRR
ncbi:MAG: cytochrome P450 [Gammaproteobacteria bacterium]|nr:cytochrome P450 [Gammaproteobacteria bacterium]